MSGNPGPFAQGSGSATFFQAASPGHPYGLWSSDATTAGTTFLADLEVSGNPGFLRGGQTLGDTAFVLVQGSGGDCALWYSGGPAGGTYVPDVRTRCSGVAIVGSRVFFAGRAESGDANGFELWVSDGTPSGTHIVADLIPGIASSKPCNLTALGGSVLFGTECAATDPFSGSMWISDGTPEGTVRVPGVQLSTSRVVSGGRLFFTNGDAAGYEPWVTDGTVAGTQLVRDIHPAGSSFPGQFAAFAGGSLFVAQTPETGVELWWSDGTDAGTRMVADSVPGPGSGVAFNLPILTSGSKAFFVNCPQTGECELWRSDGTPAGTARASLLPGTSAYAMPDMGTALNGWAFFTLPAGGCARDLWASDGGDSNLTRLGSIGPSQTSQCPTAFHHASLGSNLLYAGAGTQGGLELWMATVPTGTAPSVSLLKDLDPSTAGSIPSNFQQYNGLAYFAAVDTEHGRELWTTDGTAGGTRLFADLMPGRAPLAPEEIINVGGLLYFTDVSGYLWRTDGSVAATEKITNFPARELTNLNGTLHFLSGGIWRSDGTAAGTTKIAASPFYSYDRLERVGGRLIAFPDYRGGFPFASDGTPEGRTVFTSTRLSFLPQYPMLEWGGALYFPQHSPQHGLWRSDGSEAGTYKFKDLVVNNERFAPLGNVLLFSASITTTVGAELWATDGTPAGTQMVRDIVPGDAGSSPGCLLQAGNLVYFAGSTPEAGRELWITDGTAEGTRMVADIRPGIESSNACPSGFWRGTIWLTADDGVHGEELWRSDGSATGTGLARDINVGPAGSTPWMLGSFGDTMLLRATDNAHGTELWAVHLNWEKAYLPLTLR